MFEGFFYVPDQVVYTDIVFVALSARLGDIVIDRLGRRSARHSQCIQGTTSQILKM